MSINLTFIYIVGRIDILMESMKYIVLIILSYRVNQMIILKLIDNLEVLNTGY